MSEQDDQQESKPAFDIAGTGHKITGNKADGYETALKVRGEHHEVSENVADRQDRGPAKWHKTWWGRAAIAVLVIVLSAVLVSRLGL